MSGRHRCRPHKTESLAKKQSRSIHEKERRQQMNEVIESLMEYMPNDEKDKKDDNDKHQPKKPDKCYIIGKSVEYIKSFIDKPIIVDSILDDCINLTNCFIVKLHNFIITDNRGDSMPIFDIPSNRTIGRDIRCFLDLKSASNLSFTRQSFVNLRTLKHRMISCHIKHQPITDAINHIMVFLPIGLPMEHQRTEIHKTPSKLIEERPILAAMLMRQDSPVSVKKEEIRVKEGTSERKKDHIEINVNTTPIASLHCDSASTSSSFLSPQSCTSVNMTNVGIPTVTTKKQQKTTTTTKRGRKRLRSVNVIVESYSLDDVEKKTKKEERKEKKDDTILKSPKTFTTLLPPTPVAPSLCHPIPLHTSQFRPIPSVSTNPLDVLTPGYREVFLQIQRERMFLEGRLLQKERELQSLMVASLPSQYLNDTPTTSYININPTDIVNTTTHQ